MNQRDRCNLEVHRPDAHAARAKLLEAIRCHVIER